MRDSGRGLCPVILFLSLAFKDEAFAGGITRETIFLSGPSQVGGVAILEWNSSARERPVFLQADTHGNIGGAGLRYDTYQRIFKDLCWRAGFQEADALTPYAMRRACANAIEGKHICTSCTLMHRKLIYKAGKISSDRRNQVMGHSDGKVFRSYLSKTLSADVQSIVEGSSSCIEFIRQLQRSSVTRDERAPTSLPPELMAKVEEDEEVQKSTKASDVKGSELREKFIFVSQAPPKERAHYKALQAKARRARKRVRRELLKDHRRDWFNTTSSSPEGLISGIPCRSGSDFKAYLQIPDHRFKSEREMIATALFGFSLTVDLPGLIGSLGRVCDLTKRTEKRARFCT